MRIIKLSKSERKRFGVLFVCMFAAILAWFILSLNKKYIYNVETKVQFINEPTGKAFNLLQADTLDLRVEGTGWQLLFSRLNISSNAVQVNLKDLNHHDFIVLKDQINDIDKQLETTQKLISISPDSLFFDFSTRTIKNVPIKLISKIYFHPQFGYSDTISINPHYVSIAGSSNETQHINHWNTDSLILKDISKDIDTNLLLQSTDQSNVTLNKTKVNVKIKVDEFTEKVFEIPLSVMNNKTARNVKLYPKSVKIVLKVPLKKYKSISSEDITAAVDLNQWEIKGNDRLNIKILRIPEFSKIILIEPHTIDFLIDK